MGNNESKGVFQHGGTKPVQMDLDSFKKRSIYKEVSEEELAQAITKMESKQQELRKYQFSEDFDRVQLIGTRMPLSQAYLQKSFLFAIITGYALSRLYCNLYYKSFTSDYLVRRLWIVFGFLSLTSSHIAYFFSPFSHIINKNASYQQAPESVRGFRALDEQFNMYKYNDDIKYNFDYSGADIDEIKKKYLKSHTQSLDERLINLNKKKREMNERFL